jgi:plastocyanin
MIMKKQLTISVAALVLVASVLVGTALTGTSPFSRNKPAVADRTAQIQIFANGFEPGTLTVKPNTAVTWVDQANPGEGVVLSASTTKDAKGAVVETDTTKEEGFTRVFVKPGTYTFSSPNNPGITSKVIVE